MKWSSLLGALLQLVLSHLGSKMFVFMLLEWFEAFSPQKIWLNGDSCLWGQETECTTHVLTTFSAFQCQGDVCAHLGTTPCSTPPRRSWMNSFWWTFCCEIVVLHVFHVCLKKKDIFVCGIIYFFEAFRNGCANHDFQISAMTQSEVALPSNVKKRSVFRIFGHVIAVSSEEAFHK